MSKFAKTGMWRCRDGKVRVVSAIAPPWADQDTPLEGYEDCGQGSLPFRAWDIHGMYDPCKESPRDLIEHLSDEIADPRTWAPPVVLREGVWEFGDGSRGVVHQQQYFPQGCPRGHVVHFLTGANWACSTKYQSDGYPHDTVSGWPKATRFIGPLPTGEK